MPCCRAPAVAGLTGAISLLERAETDLACPAVFRALVRAAAGRRARISSNCWPRRSRALGAADRADRRRQDAGRVSADAGGCRALGERVPAKRESRSRPRTKKLRLAPAASVRRARRAAHALHLAAEGARRRHRAQSRNAGARNGSADAARDPHRRHAGLEAPAPAPRSARHPADDAGAARAAARQRRRAVPVRLAQARRARRTAFAGHLEARRSAVARSGAAVMRSRPASPPSACRRRWPSRTICAAS